MRIPTSLNSIHFPNGSWSSETLHFLALPSEKQMCFVNKRKYDLTPDARREVTKGVCLQDDREQERLRVKVQMTQSLGCVVPVLCAGLPGLLSPSVSSLLPPHSQTLPRSKQNGISKTTSPISREAGLSEWLWLIKLCVSVFSDFFIEQSLEHASE